MSDHVPADRPPPPPARDDSPDDQPAVTVAPAVRAALETRALEQGAAVDDLVDDALRRYLEIPGNQMHDPRAR